MNELQFANPVFHKGLNLSVRRGDKWHKRSGETVRLTDLSGNGYGVVPISGILTRFCDIGLATLQHEHDPECRTVEGLLKEMQSVYEDFNERELVTLVYFDWQNDAYDRNENPHGAWLLARSGDYDADRE